MALFEFNMRLHFAGEEEIDKVKSGLNKFQKEKLKEVRKIRKNCF